MIRHDEIVNKLANIAPIGWNPSEVRLEPTIFPHRDAAGVEYNVCANNENVSGNIMRTQKSGNRMKSYVDVCRSNLRHL